MSQIATFGTMSSKAVIRDVGRVLDMPYMFCDSLSKLIPVRQSKPLSLAKALEAAAAREDGGRGVQGTLPNWPKLEDLTHQRRHARQRRALAPGKLTDFCPLYSNDGGASVVSQCDKDRRQRSAW